MRVLFAGGGTAGHINPAVAIANYIKEQEPGSEFLFIGTKEGMESTLVPKQGYDIKFIKSQGLKRSLSLKNIKTICELISGTARSLKIIKMFKPDAVVGTGGYVAAPVLLAASMAGIPTLVHESNAFPGVTVRMLAKTVDVVALGMADAEKFLKKGARVEVTGNPVRPSIIACNRDTARAKLGLDTRPVVLIFGGSLGAEKLNSTAVEWITSVADSKKYQIIMSTGRNNYYNEVMAKLKNNNVDLSLHPEIRVQEYIYDMDLALNAADLIIARSGGSVSEMTAVGRPAILIPSPYVAGNHQEHNARAVEKAGGARVICESDLNNATLSCTVAEIIDDKLKLKEMSEASARFGIRDATDKIYRILLELIHKK